MLAKHCGFNKYDVHNLTLPQLERYLMHCHKNIKFEFEVNANSIASAVAKLFGGGKNDDSDEDYSEATDGDIDLLANYLGGGL